MKSQKFIIPVLSAFIGGIVAITVSQIVINERKVDYPVQETPTNVQFTKALSLSDSGATDFTVAAEKSVDAVVHVMTSYGNNTDYTYGNSFFDFFFGPHQMNPQPIMGSGSGVILTHDGFIVTNNHVIDNAQKIEVVLNDKRKLEAKLVGRDPSTDIALLKVDANDLPFLPFGNSDDLKVGQWVLAIGNPFNLTSTVTAGIISAKARNLQLLDDQFAIESFIQTDAAVNPGNSGGALVNLKGELIGINTAIASRTGSYAGYAFAIPSSIAKKVVTDLIEYGEVQRAVMGIKISELTEDIAQKEGIKNIKGVYVADVDEKGAAAQAGIKAGDVILSINGVDVNSASQLQEQISRFRPNQQVDVVVNRSNDIKHFSVTLQNLKGGYEYVSSSEVLGKLGAKFTEITDKQKQQLGIDYGVQITELQNGKLKDGGIKQGYIITRINRSPVKSIDDLKRILEISSGGVLIEGVYPNGVIAYYAIGMD